MGGHAHAMPPALVRRVCCVITACCQCYSPIIARARAYTALEQPPDSACCLVAHSNSLAQMLSIRPTGAAARPCTARTRCAAASSGCLSSRVALTSWGSSRHTNELLQHSAPRSSTVAGPGRKTVTMMGNKGSGGVFSPLVVVTRNVVGEKEFNKLRGKAISLHSQVIKDFCKQIGVENKQVQGVIRLAKKNGEWLGFLA